MMNEYVESNRQMWDERAQPHAQSPGYDVERLVADPTALSGVVEFDLPRLGRLEGLDVVHLQCHIGTDTVSLARLGARSITGYDISAASLAEARSLAVRCGIEATWVDGDVYDAQAKLGRQFDVVYTGVGALNWLPSIRRWAEVVAHLLRPGGRLFVRDSSPTLNARSDTRSDGLIVLEYPYFEMVEPTRFDEPGTYVETDHQFVNTAGYEWNHGIGEMLTAVLDVGMRITGFIEHDSVPWEAIEGQMERLPLGEWRLADRPERLPHSFTLQAVKG
jgi:2-polyprenyl-3-methyl-5-hydroxy-6-metoxy-1,4-benzoquinol methylase